MTLTRRAFVKRSAAVIAAAALDVPGGPGAPPEAQEARYYERIGGSKVGCLLCPRHCLIEPGKRGHCNARENRDGSLVSLVYGRPCALHVDPIEKKPFFHVLPGAQALSLATAGCNLNCAFCQNWQISQAKPEDLETRHTPPARIVEQAVSLAAPAIAFTYSEPIVFIEYAQDIAALARKHKIRSVVVSNGYIRKAPLIDLCGVVDAIKIDLKAFEDSYYRDICNATLKPVLDAIITIRERNVWLELVYLVVPTLNDDTASIRSMARWIAANLGRDVPIHLSRFYPQYRLENLPPTPVSTLDAAYDICREEGLHYVYVGNVPGHRAESTYCPNCSRAIIVRKGYRLERCDVRDGACRHCGHSIPGIWQEART